MRTSSRVVGVMLGVGSLPLVLGFGVCGGGGDDGPPAPRGCDSPADASIVTELELGPASGEFVPGTRASQTTGGQGIDMIGYRIGVRATGPIDCVAVGSATGLTSTGANLEVEPEGEWFLTDPVWLISGGTSVSVTVEGYGMRLERVMSTLDADDAGASEEPDAGL